MRINKLILLLSTSMALAQPAAAQNLSYAFGNPIVETGTEINQTGTLGLFDSNLGTLTGASLTLFGSGRSTFTFTNNAIGSTTAAATMTSNLSFGSDISSLDTLLSTGGYALVFSTGLLTVNAGATLVVGPITDSDSAVFDLGPYLADLKTPGGGTFQINGTSLSSQFLQGGGGNIELKVETLAGIGARIDYSFTPIPEPSSALLGVLGVLALLRRRR